MKASLRISMCVIVAVVSNQAMALIQYNDGGTHNISTTINTEVWVDYAIPGAYTTVNLLEGGNISPHSLKAYEDSRVNISGGFVDGYLLAYNNSQVIISAGVLDNNVEACNSSHINFTGGLITSQFYARDTSRVDIFDGLIEHGFYAYDSSQVNMSGGSLNWYLQALGDSQVTISGGEIIGDLVASDNSQMDVYGVSITRDITATKKGVLTIHGTNFEIDGQPFGYGELTSLLGGPHSSEPHRRLTGMLANGTMIDNDFSVGYDAKIVLVPEPATFLVLGLGGLVLRKKHKPL